MSLQRVVDDTVAATPGVRWSIAVTGGVTAAHRPERQLRTASIGKILLLLETARRIEAGLLDPAEPLRKSPGLAVADSGLWQHLATDTLPVADVAALIAAVSDNFATNVLLERVGLGAVAELTTALGLRRTALNDRVRGSRAPDDTRTLSNGSAGELAALMTGISRREVVSPAVSRRVDDWLAINTDLSMVAAGFDLDPLAHDTLHNKTGTDDHIRADVGHVGETAYAVLANWDAGVDETAAVMTAMRAIGGALAQAARPETGRAATD